jgi:hypothetical protein
MIWKPFFFNLSYSSGNLHYYEHLRALRVAFILKPEVFTEELFELTKIKKGFTDDWLDIVKFLRSFSDRHRYLVWAKKCCIFTDTNIDGVDMFKTGVKESVPVLGRISAIVNEQRQTFLFSNMPVFLAGIFVGKEKPDGLHLLQEFVTVHQQRHPNKCPEFTSPPPAAYMKTFGRFEDYFKQDPIIPGRLTVEESDVYDPRWQSVCVGIDRLVADTPARSSLTGVVGHNGYFGQPRCLQPGYYCSERRVVVYRDLECNEYPRLDENFDQYRVPGTEVSLSR